MTEEQKARKRAYNKEHYRKNIGARSEYHRLRWENMKRETLEILGGAFCIVCGFDDVRALQIDHKDGGGVAHYKTFTSRERYLEFVRQNPTMFQVLCANHNWIKRAERGENRKSLY